MVAGGGNRGVGRARRRRVRALAALCVPVSMVLGGAEGVIAGPSTAAGAAPAAKHSPTVTARTATHVPTLSAVVPAAGIAGTTVTLTGTHLAIPAAVHFGKAKATSVTIKSAKTLLAVAPPGKGTVSVSVKTATGTSNTESFTYEAPTLTGLSPKSGVPATEVTVKGTGFSATAVVDFAGTAAPGATVESTKAITFPVPTLAGVNKKTSEPVVVHTAAGKSTSLSFTYEPHGALKVTTTSLPGFVTTDDGNRYSATLHAVGGTGNYAWTVGAGFPRGLTLTPSSGVISGRPEKPVTEGQVATFAFPVTVTDAVGKTASATLTIASKATLWYILPATPPPARVDSPYSFTFEGVPLPTTPHTEDWTARGLPTGLTMNHATGTVSGTPTVAGTFQVVVTDTYYGTRDPFHYRCATAIFTLAVDGFRVTTSETAGFTSTLFQPSTTGTTTLQTTTATGPVHWSATGLPGGLVVNPTTGTITGSPGIGGATVGTHTVSVTATDAKESVTQEITVPITQGPLSITTASVGPAFLTTPYDGYLYDSHPFTPPNTPSSGLQYTTWSASGLPPGLSITSYWGIIDGTPTEPGIFQVTVTDENLGQYFAEAVVTLSVSPVHITTSALAGWTTMYPVPTTSGTSAFHAAGGTGTYTWSVGAGFPAGLSLTASSGQIEPVAVTGEPGAPIAAGTYHFSVTAEDAAGVSGSRSFSLTVSQGFFQITPVGSQSIDVGSSAAVFLSDNSPAHGNPGATLWFATGLPPGLVIGPSGTWNDGLVYGTATTVGTYEVTARDWCAACGGLWASTQFTIDVVSGPLQITTTSLPSGTVTAPYSASVHAQGGTGHYRFTLGGDGAFLATPTNYRYLTLATDGQISGYTELAGTYHFILQVTDGAGTTVQESMTLTVNELAPTLTPPDASAGSTEKVFFTTPSQVAAVFVNGAQVATELTAYPETYDYTAHGLRLLGVTSFTVPPGAGSPHVVVRLVRQIGAILVGTVTTPPSATFTVPFTYPAAPGLSEVTYEDTLVAPRLYLLGSGLHSVTSVTFDGSSGVILTGSPTGIALTVVVPPTLPTGPVVVSGPYGSDTFQYKHPTGTQPTITSMSPSMFISTYDVQPEGTQITVHGKNFQSSDKVQWGLCVVPYTLVGPTELRFDVPTNTKCMTQNFLDYELIMEIYTPQATGPPAYVGKKITFENGKEVSTTIRTNDIGKLIEAT